MAERGYVEGEGMIEVMRLPEAFAPVAPILEILPVIPVVLLLLAFVWQSAVAFR